MTIHFQQALRALILLAFAALLIKLHITDEITKFINPKYIRLSQVASFVLFILFFIQLTRIWTTNHESHHHCDHTHDDNDCHHHHDHGDAPFTIKTLFSYSIIAFPLVTGFFLPAKVLDASIVDKKGGMAILANQKENTTDSSTGEDSFGSLPGDSPSNEETETEYLPLINENPIENLMSKEEYDQLIQDVENSNSIIMDDTVFAAFYEEIGSNLETYKGKEIELTGMVYKEEGLEQNQLVLSRFFITHCVADASVIGFLSEFAQASSIDQDTWIKANGILEVTMYNGVELPIIKVTDWERVEEPSNPYLYPISVRIL